ncbi:MAG: hypothetical protein ACRDG7_06945, partial [Candidatus Limnocylindria bacterium]
MRRLHASTATLATLALVLAACTGVQQTESDEPPSSGAPSGGDPSTAAPTDGGTATGGTVRIGTGGYPDSLNPGNGVLAEAYAFYELVYD